MVGWAFNLIPDVITPEFMAQFAARVALGWGAPKEEAENDAERLSGSFAAFHPEAFKIIDPGVSLVSDWYLDAMIEHLEWWMRGVDEGGIQNLIIRICPRMLKTLTASVLLQAWALTWRPTAKFLWATHSPDRQKAIINKCRALVKSNWYQSRWPTPMAEAQDEAHRFAIDAGGQVYSANYGTGALGDGGDRLGLDDPQTDSDLRSPAKADAQWQWFLTTWQERLDDPNGGGMLYLSQCLPGGNDIGHRIVADFGDDWDRLCLQSRKTVVQVKTYWRNDEPFELPLIDTRLSREKGFKDPRKVGEWLSSRQNVRRLESIERAEPEIFAAVHQQTPVRGTVSGAAFHAFTRERHVGSFASRMGCATKAEAIARARLEGWQVGSYFDHGTGGGRQWMTIEIWNEMLQEEWAVASWANAGVSSIDADAEEMRALIVELGIPPRAMVDSCGDVGNLGVGSSAPAMSINARLSELLGFAISVPFKGPGSVDANIADINLLLGSGGAHVDESCKGLIQCIENWRKGKEAYKDGADSYRYGLSRRASRWLAGSGDGWTVQTG